MFDIHPPPCLDLCTDPQPATWPSLRGFRSAFSSFQTSCGLVSTRSASLAIPIHQVVYSLLICFHPVSVGNRQRNRKITGGRAPESGGTRDENGRRAVAPSERAPANERRWACPPADDPHEKGRLRKGGAGGKTKAGNSRVPSPSRRRRANARSIATRTAWRASEQNERSGKTAAPRLLRHRRTGRRAKMNPAPRSGSDHHGAPLPPRAKRAGHYPLAISPQHKILLPIAGIIIYRTLFLTPFLRSLYGVPIRSANRL